MDTLREFMEKIALEAGKRALEGYENLNGVTAKETAKDVVTEVDRALEEYIVDEIRKKYPEHSIYGEETGKSGNLSSEYCWVIDPIDGTASYEHGQIFYCVSIGLQKRGKSIAGVIYAPRLNELYYAEKEKGAFLNGERIHVSDRENLLETTFATGFACLRINLAKNNLKTFCAMAPLVREQRRYGSAALDLANLAAGRIDFEWEYPLKSYDVAAGVILVEEAGGTVTDFDGGTDYPEKGIVSSNGHLHEEVRRIIMENDYR